MEATVFGVGKGRPKKLSLRKGYIVNVGTDMVEVSKVFHDSEAQNDVVSGWKLNRNGNKSGFACFAQKAVKRFYRKEDRHRALQDLREIRRSSKND